MSTTSKTLYITGIPAGDALLQRDGTALLIGMLLDQQVPMEQCCPEVIDGVITLLFS
jgi:hypothetical protein